jgi:hypothetical protein
MTVPFAAVVERFMTGVPSHRNVQVVPPAEQWSSRNWPGVPPIKTGETGEAGVGEAVSGPSAASPLHDGYSGHPPSSWLLTSP